MSTDLTEQWSNMQKMFLPTSEVSTALQKMFLPTPEIAATFRENTRRFWENQGRVLDSMQALTNSWFERRHTGDSFSTRSRRAYVWNRDILRSDADVSGLGPRSI